MMSGSVIMTFCVVTEFQRYGSILYSIISKGQNVTFKWQLTYHQKGIKITITIVLGQFLLQL